MNHNRFAVSPYLLALVVAFSLMFFHTIFLANDDHLLVGLLSIDPGIIVHGIESLFGQPVYNQFNSYGSTAYGWFFNDLNFLVILILKFLGQLLGYYDQPIFTAIYDQPLFNGAIRAITFTTALLSILMFFQVSNLLFGNRKLSFIVTLFFMFIPFGSKFAYYIHPDATGMLLMLIAIHYLLLFIKQKPKAVYFYLSFVSLVLATLSKHPFLFIAIPILLMFLSAHCHQTRANYINFIWSGTFVKIFFSLVILSVVILFVVHPYSIIDYSRFLASQRYVTESQTFGSGISLVQSFQKWMVVYRDEPLVYVNLLFLPLLVIYYLFLKSKFAISAWWAISVLFCNVFMLMIVPSGGRLFFTTHYVYPILPLLLWNIIAVILFIWKILGKREYFRYAFAMIVAILVLPIFSKNVLLSINAMLLHSSYQHLTGYQAREFSTTQIPFDKPVLIDPSLSLTIRHTHSCNTWNCPNYEAIRTFDPSFILLEKGYQWVDHKLVYQYITDHQFELIKKIEANTQINFPADSFGQTKELLEVLCDPNWLIGPNILIYQKKMK